jgi:hypothetical protein
VVACVAVVPAILTDGKPGTTHPTTPSPSPTPSVADISCPPPDEPTHGPGTVLEGAVAVRLCQGRGAEFDVPDDALSTDVARVAAAINRQPAGPAPLTCDADLGRGYQLVFGYSDGHTQNVSGELYGCHTLTVGGSYRTDSAKPFNTFVELLRDQRATSDPPADAASPPQCGAGGLARLSPVGQPEEMVAATLCVTYHAVTDQRPQPAPVNAKQLEVLLHDRVPGAPPPYDVDRPALLLVGETAWRDRTELSMDGVDGWVPGPDAQRILNRLTWYADRPIPTVDASSTAEYVVAAYVDLLNADAYNEMMELWHPLSTPDLPSGPWSIDYEFESVRPLPSISAYADATAVTGSYRQVPADGSYTPYREATFVLGRDDQGVFRLVSVQIGKVVETGR